MRWIVGLFGVVLSLALLLVAALFIIPAERIARVAAERFEAGTGRALTITGPVRPSVWPVIGARVEDVRLANAPWSDGEPMFAAAALDLGLDLRALMAGDIVIRKLQAEAPRILVERGPDGATNWDFGGGGTGTAGERRLSLELAQMTGGVLRVRDSAAGTDLLFEEVEMELRLPDLAGPADLRATGRHGGQPFVAEARVGAAQRFLEGGVAPLALSVQAGGSSLRFEGRGGLDPWAVEGRLAVEGQELRPLLALAGQVGELPAEARPFAVAGQVTLAPAGSLHLREGSLQLGPNRLTAALDLSTDGPRPKLSGEVAADVLDLRGWTQAGGDAAGAEAAGWSRAPIDASAVGFMDAALNLRAAAVETGYGRVAPAHLGLTIDRARAVFDLREAGIHEGRLGGEFVINNRSGLSVGGNLRADEMALLPLLRQVAGVERLTGTGSASLRFLGVGQSMDAIMRSLSGEGRLELGRGEIVGLDLAGMLRNLDLNYVGDENRTVYDSLTGSFAIEGGVLRNQDLRMEARALSVEGRGTVDLGQRELDFRVVPVALRDGSDRAMRVPLRITGPWDAPRYRLDLESLAEERLREERVRLEARAREEVERRLGLERQEGRSSREALIDEAQRRLEDELARGLQRLFGGRQ
jgi:AsmA protein